MKPGCCTADKANPPRRYSGTVKRNRPGVCAPTDDLHRTGTAFYPSLKSSHGRSLVSRKYHQPVTVSSTPVTPIQLNTTLPLLPLFPVLAEKPERIKFTERFILMSPFIPEKPPVEQIQKLRVGGHRFIGHREMCDRSAVGPGSHEYLP